MAIPLRQRISLRETQGKRVNMRVTIGLFGFFGGHYRYMTMNRAGVVLSCKDARQAEAALVTIMKLVESLDGLELQDPKLVMERL